MKLARTKEQLRQFIREWKNVEREEKNRRDDELCVAFVPTMGALHDGHLELVRRARQLAALPSLAVIVSIFVNPLQFAPNEAFSRYPRTLDSDLALLENLAVDFVFIPEATEILGGDQRREGEERKGEGEREGIRVSAGWLGRMLEGRSRPTYFDGVLTVVAKLFNIVLPDVALFGEKDAQQLFAIQQMVKELHFPVRIVPVETQRAPDGLALSSRNRYLSEADRELALSLWRALSAGRREAENGSSLRKVLEVARQTFFEKGKAPKVELDYLEAVDAKTFETISHMENFRGGEVILLVAALVGGTRLIDNLPMWIRENI